jgi:DNA-binding MarR family transcriptional regulator
VRRPPANDASPAPLPPLGDALEFMRLLWAVDHGLHQRSKRMAAALGVTGPQRLVVRVLGRFPGLSAGHLARVLHLHPSTLTGVLGRLQAKGLLTRRADPDDRRRAFLGLSAAGRRLDVDAAETVESIVTAVLARRPPTEVRAARELLAALAAGLDDGLGRTRSATPRDRTAKATGRRREGPGSSRPAGRTPGGGRARAV